MNMRAAENLIPQSFAPESAVSLPSRDGWLEERRARAMRAFQVGGIPHRRVEEWKYSDLRNALDAEQGEKGEAILLASRDPFATIDGPRLVVRDGSFEASPISIPDNVEVLDLGALGDNAPDWIRQSFGCVLATGMAQASLALMRGGVAIRIRRGTEAQLHLRFLQQIETVHSRVLVEIEEGGSLLLMESHAGMRGVTNLGQEILLRPNAQVTHVRLADAAPDAVLVEEIGVAVARDARYRAHLPQAGARLSRLELAIRLEGKGAQAALDGVGVLSGKLHADVTTHIEHVA